MKWGKTKPLTRQTLYSHLLKSKFKQHYKHKNRASRFPICPVEYLFDRFYPKDILTDWHFHSDFYCSVGTTIHEVLQRHLTLLGVLFGNWECLKCGKKLFNKLSPLRCCKQVMLYVEYEFLHKHFSAHMDGVTVLIHKGKLEVYLNEFKSYGGQTLKEPYPEHAQQINTYYALFLEMIKKNDIGFKPSDIKGLWIWYVNRKNPSQRKEFMLTPNAKHANKSLKENINLIMRAKNAAKTKNLTKVKQRCENSAEGKECPWQERCFGPQPYKKILKGLMSET